MKDILFKIIQSEKILARFLNTLSLLEYIGARKILKSQHQEAITEKILAHAQEEIRHAQVLKRAALKLSPDLCATYVPESLLCGKEATHYFQTIDHALNERDSWQAYLFTTWLIEIRAVSLYTLFDEVLMENNKSAIFRGILQEEQNHLDEILSWLQTIPDHQAKMQQLKIIEEQAFLKWMESIESYLCAPCTFLTQ